MGHRSAPERLTDQLMGRGDPETTPGLTPVPLDLVDIPIVRAVQKLEPRNEAGELPRKAYYLDYRITDLAGVHYRIEISGSSEYGMPYGQDTDILIALFSLIDVHGYYDGVIRNPTYREIASFLDGRPDNPTDPDGRRIRRIRDALRRFGQVSILTTAVRDTTQLALRIQDSRENVHPLLPTQQVRPVEQEQSLSLLDYDVQIEDDPGRPGEYRHIISRLEIAPFWVAQAVAGWLAWVDLPIHTALTSPKAKRLHCVLAARASRGLPAPWRWSLAELRASCSLGDSLRPAEARDRILSAAGSLVDVGVLASCDYSGRRGQYTFQMQPGPQLREVELLRGIGIRDLQQLRVQVALLRHFGIAQGRARQMVLEDAGRVRRVLERALYLVDRKPSKIKRPSAWIRSAYENHWIFETDSDFIKWAEGEDSLPLLKGHGSGGTPIASTTSVPTQGPVSGDPPDARESRPDITPSNPSVESLWAEIIRVVRDRAVLPGFADQALESLVPYRLDEGILTVVYRYEFYRQLIERHDVLRVIGEALPEDSAQKLNRVRLVAEEDVGPSSPGSETASEQP